MIRKFFLATFGLSKLDLDQREKMKRKKCVFNVLESDSELVHGSSGGGPSHWIWLRFINTCAVWP